MTFLTPFTPSKGPLAVVLAYNSSRTALMSALLLVSALSHGAEQSGAGKREIINVQGRLLLLVSALSRGAERSKEQRNNKCPGKILQCSTALGFGIVTRTIW